MRNLLWPPEGSDDHSAEIARFFAGDTLVICPGGGAMVLVAVAEREDGRLGGFIEAGLRPFAAGCDSRPVGYIEGWFVDDDLRRHGVGWELARAAEAWARQQGCTEMASDCHLDNEVSRTAHARLGYSEYERVVQFCKRLS